MHLQTERWLPRIFGLVLVILLAIAGWQSRHGLPVSSNLLELLPHTQTDELTRQAEARIQAPLSRQLIAMTGSTDSAHAVHAAQALARDWTQSGLFSSVDVDINVDLPALRAQLLTARIAALPAADRDLLRRDPVAFTTQRARELMNPFAAGSIVSIDEDWLGLAHRTEQALTQSGGLLRYDVSSGTLQAKSEGKTWVAIRAHSHGDAFDANTAQRIGALIDQSRSRLTSENIELLAMGGALYAAAGRAEAMREGSWIALGSTLGIVFVLLMALQRSRALLAFVPVAVGMLTGFVACVMIFGSVHALTLVIGASLIGVAVDYPMHWLGKSYGLPQWQAWSALRHVRPGLTLSLVTSLIGYLALALAPFPALTQTAAFSVAGLLGAYACTVCLLPAWLANWRPLPRPSLLRVADVLVATLDKAIRQRGLIGVAALVLAGLCIGGITRLSLHDDLRQWLSLPEILTQQAKKIGDITGFTPTSQFFLVRAPNVDTLLERQETLTRRLDKLVAQRDLASYTALNQLMSSAGKQDTIRTALRALSVNETALAPLTAISIPIETLQRHIRDLATAPAQTLETVLEGPLSERWRPLWLGQSGGITAGMVSLTGLRSADALLHVADGIPGTVLVDRSGDLNRMFSTTRVHAAELKLASYVAAALLLWLVLGRSAAWRILAVPFAATVCSLAVLGFIGQPLTLFSLFGLLLVTAIGVDYSIFMYEQIGGASASLVGVFLGGVTTLLSFGLLALSSTPAIASFGLSVALGVMFSLLWAPWVRPPAPQTMRGQGMPPRTPVLLNDQPPCS